MPTWVATIASCTPFPSMLSAPVTLLTSPRPRRARASARGQAGVGGRGDRGRRSSCGGSASALRGGGRVIRRYLRTRRGAAADQRGAAMAYRADFLVEGVMAARVDGVALLPLSCCSAGADRRRRGYAPSALIVVAYFIAVRAAPRGGHPVARRSRRALRTGVVRLRAAQAGRCAGLRSRRRARSRGRAIDPAARSARGLRVRAARRSAVGGRRSRSASCCSSAAWGDVRAVVVRARRRRSGSSGSTT